MPIAILLAAAEMGGCERQGHYVIASSSMAPTINPGEMIVSRPYHLNCDSLHRYDVIVFNPPVLPQAKWVMRVIGLPSERITISTNGPLVNGVRLPDRTMPPVLDQRFWLTPELAESNVLRTWNLGTDEVFVIGDNLTNANDSRYWGPLKLASVIGVVQNVRARRGLRIELW
jgi:signal peptidase I